jgi:ribosomal protein S20
LANIKSAMKRAKTSVGENLRNRMDKSALKTAVRRFDEALKSGDKEAVNTAYLAAVKTVDQSAAKGVIHKNAADRKKAQLAKKRAAENN